MISSTSKQHGSDVDRPSGGELLTTILDGCRRLAAAAIESRCQISRSSFWNGLSLSVSSSAAAAAVFRSTLAPAGFSGLFPLRFPALLSDEEWRRSVKATSNGTRAEEAVAAAAAFCCSGRSYCCCCCCCDHDVCMTV